MQTHLKPTDAFTFGKYKGRLIKEVIEQDPSYVVWAADNVKGFNLSPQMLKKARDNKQEQEADSYEDIFDWWDLM